jgi:hypothetical protein
MVLRDAAAYASARMRQRPKRAGKGSRDALVPRGDHHFLSAHSLGHLRGVARTQMPPTSSNPH